jgi:hypothetical protein
MLTDFLETAALISQMELKRIVEGHRKPQTMAWSVYTFTKAAVAVVDHFHIAHFLLPRFVKTCQPPEAHLTA